MKKLSVAQGSSRGLLTGDRREHARLAQCPAPEKLLLHTTVPQKNL
jgi:hypothetical protein